MKYIALFYLLVTLLSSNMVCAQSMDIVEQKTIDLSSNDSSKKRVCHQCMKTKCHCKRAVYNERHDNHEHIHEEKGIENCCDQCNDKIDIVDELQSKCSCNQQEKDDDKNKGCCVCDKQKCDCSEHANQPKSNEQDNTKCDNCPEGDPIEETTQLVLQAAPSVLNSFIKIVQDPDNKENVTQNITNIVANIATIAANAFKGKEKEILEKRLRQQLERIVVVQILKLRKSL
ncbi:hypothetical protein KC460_01900 [Candidatus Dependentiae bacterium]|nr:hypothetical protein [Candidatus Dependentiae bacterium]